MPPKIQYTKADLLRAAFKLTRTRGIGAVNARAIAKELGCSTQPIFRAFHAMDEIRQEMLRMGMDLYGMYITHSGAGTDKPYLRSGMAYLLFAKEEPELFKLLFMRDRVSDGTMNENQDHTLAYVLDLVMQNTGFDRDTALKFHTHLWIYTHGLAVMLATQFVSLENDAAEQYLKEQYQAVRRLYNLPPVPDEAPLASQPPTVP